MFFNKGNIIRGIINFSAKEAVEECSRGAGIIDLRRENEYVYKRFDVKVVVYHRPEYVYEHYDEMPNDVPIIIADNAGLRSKEVVEFLIEKGFTNVANLAGGMFEWDRDNMPILVDNKERLSGSCLCVLRKTK